MTSPSGCFMSFNKTLQYHAASKGWYRLATSVKTNVNPRETWLDSELCMHKVQTYLRQATLPLNHIHIWYTSIVWHGSIKVPCITFYWLTVISHYRCCNVLSTTKDRYHLLTFGFPWSILLPKSTIWCCFVSIFNTLRYSPYTYSFTKTNICICTYDL